MKIKVSKYFKQKHLTELKYKGADKLLYRPGYPLSKYHWDFHKYDDDPFPSIPHGHSGKYRLNVYTGLVTDSTTGQIVDRLTKKEMKRLFVDPRFVEVFINEREYHRAKNPQIVFPEIDPRFGIKVRKSENIGQSANSSIKVLYSAILIRRERSCKRIVISRLGRHRLF